MRYSFAGMILVLAFLPVFADEPETPWVNLFNGKNLEGWVQRGGKAKYRVEDKQIVGASVPNTKNSFLCTKKNYADFVLELEFKVHPELNSGVQIRSQSKPVKENVTDPETGASFTVPGQLVYGYQVEIDPSKRAWTGGIYDESRRGWLFDLKKNEPARKAFKQNEWNKFRIECKGPSIKTWLNGVPAADLNDKLTPSGFIALQVHGVGNKKEPLEVRFRDLRIKEWK